jgi:hypothetical protein
MSKRFGVLAALLLFLLLFASCGSKDCSLRILVAPQNTSADHSAASPANAVQFTAQASFPSDCPSPPIAALSGVTWAVSDPVNVSLTTSGPGAVTVTATCLNTTASAVTVTGSVSGNASGSQTIKGTAKLKCN